MKSVIFTLALLFSISANAAKVCDETVATGVTINGVSFCEGIRVMDQYGNVGTITEVFNNKMANLTLDGYPGNFTRALSTLARAFKCVETVCQGGRIIDQYGNTGTMIEVFSNGYSSLILDGYLGKFSRTFVSLGFGVTCSTANPCQCRD